jgi:hypothetical protein
MTAPARAPHPLPPAYYLGRPAAWWRTALHPPRQRLTRPAAAGQAKGGALG